MDDMRGPFERYVETIEPQFAHVGICKIVPPKAWLPRKAGYDDIDGLIPKPIRQHATGRQGLFRTLLVEGKPMSVRDEFKPMAESKENLPKLPDDVPALEREFWKRITYAPPLYGADVEGSLFDEKCNGWNVRKLNTVLSRTLESNGLSLPGVTTPYLYWGMWRSAFAWHTEDMDLYSINYLHFGQPKSWYTIQPAHRARFEALVEGLIPELMRNCPQFLRHKEILVSPTLLKQHNIPVVRTVQHPREFILNFPGAYHSGFNHGFNCAESTNFGTKMWVPVGCKAKFCRCSGDAVYIDMNLFLPSHLQKPDPADAKLTLAGAATQDQLAHQAGASEQGRKLKLGTTKAEKAKALGRLKTAAEAEKAARVLKVKSISLKTPDGVKALVVRTAVKPRIRVRAKQEGSALKGNATDESALSKPHKPVTVQKSRTMKDVCARAASIKSVKASAARLVVSKAQKARAALAGASPESVSRAHAAALGIPPRAATTRKTPDPSPLASRAQKTVRMEDSDSVPRKRVSRLAKGEEGWLRPVGHLSTPSTKGGSPRTSPSLASPVVFLSNDPHAPRQTRSGKTTAAPPLLSDRKRKQPDSVSTASPTTDVLCTTTTAICGLNIQHHQTALATANGCGVHDSPIHTRTGTSGDNAEGPSSTCDSPMSEGKENVRKSVKKGGGARGAEAELGWVECVACGKFCGLPLDRLSHEPTTKWACSAVDESSCDAPVSLLAPRLGMCGSESKPSGWQRWVTERKKRKKATAHKWEVSYCSPCGQVLHSRQEVARFLLQQPQYCNLSATHFCFDTRSSGDKARHTESVIPKDFIPESSIPTSIGVAVV
eukprot:CAMPEP_0198229740 /NCGR_PEP_ID=MMETSP1445-20131203/114280_1 /TAXON_ID=36898 /ORGANISM="Pyramimonas sp., Strain CCMP2087" /LENGTH=830 /DNA_ID=CAMNT_0043910213 /DNA_START=305 /DNA_END=2798 /DNA_ORIENTATION=+